MILTDNTIVMQPDDVNQRGEYTNLHNTLDRLENSGVTVNTLYMITNNEEPISFYESLTRGNGFSIVAESIMHFELSLFEKLSLELVQLKQ